MVSIRPSMVATVRLLRRRVDRSNNFLLIAVLLPSSAFGDIFEAKVLIVVYLFGSTGVGSDDTTDPGEHDVRMDW